MPDELKLSLSLLRFDDTKQCWPCQNITTDFHPQYNEC